MESGRIGAAFVEFNVDDTVFLSNSRIVYGNTGVSLRVFEVIEKSEEKPSVARLERSRNARIDVR